jgi:hypothetical protein
VSILPLTSILSRVGERRSSRCYFLHKQFMLLILEVMAGDEGQRHLCFLEMFMEAVLTYDLFESNFVNDFRRDRLDQGVLFSPKPLKFINFARTSYSLLFSTSSL